MNVSIELQSQIDRLIAAIRAAGGKDDFVNRRQIAKALDKKQLNAAEIVVLDVMKSQGVISVAQRDNRSPVGWEWVYKVK